MDSVRWARIQTLFHDAVDRPPAEQRAFLIAACADDPTLVDEVLAILEEDARSNSLLDQGLGSVAGFMLGAHHVNTLDPTQFLPYRLTAPLGEGGMGVVFLAERDDLGMQVAIKILRDAWFSPARRERFAAEQRTLAQLSHPGIARLYDAHTLSDGTPWFVMEYVDGVPLTDYCAIHQCSFEQRLGLFRAVCEAVQYAHERGVIHRDLKPSNILVKKEGAVRLLDFGIAKQLDPATNRARTTIPLMTPAYAAPEQLRGEAAGITSDIYSLGVILYELLAGRLPVAWKDKSTAGFDPSRTVTKPSVAVRESAEEWRARLLAGRSAAWADLDGLCLTAMHEDPKRRYQTVAALIRDIDHFLKHEPLEARPDSLPYTLRKLVRRRWRTVGAAVALLVGGGGLALAVSLAANPVLFQRASTAERTVAVMPFRNVESDPSLDYLRQAVPDEIATTLGFRRGLAVRSFAATSRYTDDTLDFRRVGQAIGVGSIVTGRFQKQGADVLIMLESVDVASNKVVWQDRLTVEPGNLIALQGQVATRAAGGLASALGATAVPTSESTRPSSEEAYELYLRSSGGRYDPGPWNGKAIAMLERAVALDSTYAPAWLALARRYYIAARYETGDLRLLEKSAEAGNRALSLDPDYIIAGARMAGLHVERGELPLAYRKIRELIRRRPDSPDVHFAMSYVLRFAGLLKESARECEIAMSADSHNFSWRSCAVASLLRGDNDGAMGYLGLDPGSEWSKALTIHMLVRAGKETEALAVGRPNMPQWKSYDLLLACIARRPASEIDSLAAVVRPDDDPETNYFAASHLAYCGQTDTALEVLERAIQGGYCSYPVIDTDPYFARVRVRPEFTRLRARAAACQAAFLAEAGK